MLRLKDGFKISPETVWATQRVVRDGDGQVFATWTSNGMVNVLPRNGILGCACSNAELAHEYLLDCGSESPWVDVLTAEEMADAELTAAAEGEGTAAVEPPAPRLCALDRLIVAGFVTRLCDERVALYSPAFRGITVSVKPTRLVGYFRAELFSTAGDEVEGLNAALESLLSKPVGAVTVAQILGVA